jgi:predicted transposase YbfD/YdcC
MEKLELVGYFNEVETIKEHNGYKHSVGRTLTIVILGSLCGLTEIEKIHQWAKNERVSAFLKEQFAICTIPTSSWMETMLSIINPEALNKRFTSWATTLLPKALDNLTIAFDGKSICSTGKTRENGKPLHILSAYLCELGLTISQKTVKEKSNEIPAMRELLELIDIRGCMVVADALHCQTETAEVIINCGGDYLLNAKSNQETLQKDIEDYIQDDALRAEMESSYTREQNGGRVEYREAFVSHDIDWMGEQGHLKKWLGLSFIGAINRRSTVGKETSSEWHYYISSRKLTPAELLKYARNEWAIESMHWLLDVRFCEDSCRIQNDNANQNLNMIRKIALNYIRKYKKESGTNLPFSRLMFACLLDCEKILDIVNW